MPSYLYMKTIFTAIVLVAGCILTTQAQTVYEVDSHPGYNCWPMIQHVGRRLVCIYTIGKHHDPWEKGRAAYARHSDDGAKTWSEKVLMDHNASYGTSSIGKGTDKMGMRCSGSDDLIQTAEWHSIAHPTA